MKPERILLNYKKNKALYWMILPVLAYVCIFNYLLPMIARWAQCLPCKQQ